MQTENPWINLIGRLRDAEIESDHLELAEMAWLSLILPAPPPTARPAPVADAKPGKPGEPPPQALPHGMEPEKIDPAAMAEKEKETTDEAKVYANAPGADGKTRASRVRVPGVPALPDLQAINRAMRPLLRRKPSRRIFVLDEEATVSLSADAGCALPVYRGMLERRFDAAIVVEEKPTMSVWRDTIREFQRLLERHGSFGDVRRYALQVDLDEDASRLITVSNAEQSPAAIHDPTGRRIVFFFSDGVSHDWARGAIPRLMVDWAERMPVVMVQMLSPHLWRMTSLGLPRARTASRQPGSPNFSLDVLPPSHLEDAEKRLHRRELLPLPIVTLDPRHLASWAAMLMGGAQTAEAYLLPSKKGAFVQELTARQSELLAVPENAGAEELVERFDARVSPAAFRLAGYLSLVPLHLPIMFMVQRLMMPESRIEHLSEVLLGGILRRADHPELPLEEGEIAFEFVDENIRDLLIEPQVRRFEAMRILDAMSNYVEREYGITCDFKALVEDEQGALEVPEKALPIARLAKRTLEKYGVKPRRKEDQQRTSNTSGQEAELDKLIAQLRSDEAEAAIEALVRQAGKSVSEKLRQALTDPEITEAAIRALLLRAIARDERSYGALQQAILEYSEDIRFLVFDVVKKHPAPEAPNVLRDLVNNYIQLLNPWKSEESYRKLIETLEIPGCLWAAEILLNLTGSAHDDHHRLLAAEALGGTRVPSILPALARTLPSALGHGNLCLALIRAYAEIGGGVSALEDLRKTFFYDDSESMYQRLLPDLDRVIRELEFNRQGLLVHDFTVVKLDEYGKEVQRYERSAGYFEDDLGNGVKIKMVAIPGGEFLMGSLPEEKRSYDRERPQHRVSVPPFFMGMHQVTQAQWRAVANMKRIERDLKPEPSHFKGDDRPVEQITWEDAQEFCRRLSNSTGKAYRLPSEAEWEYACRAGSTTPFHFGPTITTVFVNYRGDAYGKGPEGKRRDETTPVGSFEVANDFGLYDMHGNVWEWCEDDWHGSYDASDRPDDGSAWIKRKEVKQEGLIEKVSKRIRRKPDSDDVKDVHVLRGGSWIDLSGNCRSAYRSSNRFVNIITFIGFRVVVSSRTA